MNWLKRIFIPDFMRETGVRRYAYMIAFFMRLGAISCFLYGGALGAKEVGPDMFAQIKHALFHDPTDPMTLYKMERERQKAFEADKARAKAALAEMGGDGSMTGEGSGVSGGDPYAFIAGGKKADKDKNAKAGEDGNGDSAAASALAGAAGAGAQNLLGKNNTGTGSINQMASAFGGAGGSGAGMGNMPGQTGAGNALGNLGKTKGGPGADLSAAGGGLSGAGGKSGRSKKHGVRGAGKKMSETKGGAMAQLRKAGNQTSITSFNSNIGNAQGGSQMAVQQVGGAFGQAQTGGSLNIPIVADAGGIVGAGENLSTPNPNQNTPASANVPGNQERAEDYDQEIAFLNWLSLAISVIGIILALTQKMKDSNPWTSAWWTGFWIVGAVLIVVLAGTAAYYARESDYAKGLFSAYYGVALQLAIGWGMLLAKGEALVKTMAQVQGAIQPIMSLIGGSGSR